MDDFLKKMQEFSNIYRSKIVPVFRTYEPLRAKLGIKFQISNFVRLATIYSIIVMFFAMLIFKDKIAVFEAIFVLFFVYVAIYAYNYKVNCEVKKFKNMLKEHCLDEVLKVFGDIKRINKPKESVYELEKSEIFFIPESITYDDCYEGVYNGVPFSIIEYSAVYGSGKNRRTERKVLFITKANKKVNATTTFQTKEKSASITFALICLLVPAFLILVSIIKAGTYDSQSLGYVFVVLVMVSIPILLVIRALKNKINLEDVKMQKDFFVKSSDQVEGRYLLTPAFIERFKALQKIFKTKEIAASFYGDDKFMIKMDAENDLFELCQINKSLLDIECMKKFFSEMKVIYDIIDYLKLDEKTGM